MELSSQTNNSALILLTGGTGYVGGRLLTSLEEDGWRVRCIARRPERIGFACETVYPGLTHDRFRNGLAGESLEEWTACRRILRDALPAH